MILRSTLRIRHDALEDSQQLDGFNTQPGFFPDLAPNAVSDRLPGLEHSAWQRPPAFQRLAASLHKQNASVVIEDKRANPKNRSLRITP